VKPFVIIFAMLGVLFAAAAALVSGGVVTSSGAGWLLPGAVACLGLSWLLSLLG
jgi:hypothetical protein